MDYTRFRRLFTAVLVVSLFVPVCFAQDADEDEEESSRSVSLNLVFDKRGNADVSLYSYEKQQDWTPIIAGASAALHCPVGNFAHPAIDTRAAQFASRYSGQQRAKYLASIEDANQMQMTAKCPALLHKRGMMAIQAFDFAQLAGTLRNAGAEQLSVWITLPDAPSWEFSKPNRILLPTNRDTTFATYAFVLTDKPSPAVVNVSYGLQQKDVLRVAGELALFLLLPTIILIWLRRAALRRGQEDRIAAWFSYFRAASLTVNGFILLWFVTDLNCRDHLNRIAYFLLEEKSLSASFVHIPILFGPAALIYLVSVLLSHRVFVEVRGTNWSRRNYVAQQLLQIGGIWLPMAFLLGGITVISKQPKVGVTLFVAAYVIRIMCVQWTLKLMQAYPQPLTTGDLRDRIMGMATKMGVKVKQIMVLPAGKAQIANAAAASNNMVMFTDYLLQKLTRREVDAIAAHELTHLKRSHPAKLVFAMLGAMWFPKIVAGSFGFMSGLALAAIRITHSPAAMLWSWKLQRAVAWLDNWKLADAILLPIGLAGFYLLSRRFEHQADTGAVMMTQDPEAMISGLVKLGNLNLMPIQWSRRSEMVLTHPSTVRRAQYLAKRFGISDAQLQILIETARNAPLDHAVEPVAEHAPVTSVATSYAGEIGPERMQSPSAVKSLQRTHRNLWIMVAAHCIPPALIAFAVSKLALPSNVKLGVYIAGAMITIALYAITSRWLALAGRSNVLNEFKQRFEASGIPVGTNNGIFAGFSPGPWPRFYVTSYDWDRGFIFLSNDRLSYIGEQARFSLTPQQIVNVQLGPGAPSWWRYERLYVTWKDPATGRGGTFNMSAAEPSSLFKIKRLNRSMQQRLLEWWRTPAGSPETLTQFEKLEPPRAREVTCKSPREMGRFGNSMKVTLLFVLPASYGMSLLMNVSFAYVFAVAMLVRLYEIIPYWRYRDPIIANPAARQRALTASTS